MASLRDKTMKSRIRLRWPLLLIAILFGLYQMKAAVEEREKALTQSQRAVTDEREALQILRAEWAYLNQPERLARLADRRLSLRPAAGAQFATLNHLPSGLLAETTHAGAGATAAMSEPLPAAARNRTSR
jgi:hypothetical protein